MQTDKFLTNLLMSATCHILYDKFELKHE